MTAISAALLTGCGGSSKAKSAPTAADFKGVLLTTAEVNKTANNTFTAGPIGPDDTSKTGCAALDAFMTAAKGTEKARVGSSFDTADQKTTAEEDLSYVPSKAAPLFKTLKVALKTCHSFASGGATLDLKVLPDPAVDGSDDTVAFEATATVSGQSIDLALALARFGDDLVSISYGGVTTNAGSVSSTTVTLLQQAAAKAKDVV